MQMSVSELSRSRPAAEASNKPGVFAAIGAAIGSVFTKVRSSLVKFVSLIFSRVLLIFVIGFAAGMAWQVYGGGIRKAVAGWSPRLAWVAPAATPADSPRDRLKATSVALAGVRQSVEKLATEVDKLQDQGAGEQRSAAAAGSGSRRGNQRR
jgi:adenylosuccinate lyase